MVLLYHIHRGLDKIKINKQMDMFMSKKNSFWWSVEIRIGKMEYGGYIEYEIDIPKNKFTKNKGSDKILILNEKNLDNVNLNDYKENYGGIHTKDETVIWNYNDVKIRLNRIIDSNMKPPFKVECYYGWNGEKPIRRNDMEDVYCVALNKKPLAVLDYSKYGQNKIKKHFNIKDTNKIIEYCNSKGVEMIHYNQIGGMYLKSIFFKPENKKNAIKLMYLLWSKKHVFLDPYDDGIAIGILLGYKYENIKYFVKDFYNIDIDNKYINKIKEILNDMEVEFLDNVKHYYEIEYLK